ncbi:hypothetical protein RhoFasSB10_02314 [Rhodococcus fascians]|uniref:hypothetical protein n=1 Tax=Rhodococcoides fascians TaxID=1828 RepID=UPI001427CA65|nr:hypothetical protein [Rhodococcus fascians]
MSKNAEMKLWEVNMIEKLSGEKIADADQSYEFQAAFAYVLDLRKDGAAAKKLSFGQHRQAFEDYFFELETDHLAEIFEEHGFAGEESEDEKKD